VDISGLKIVGSCDSPTITCPPFCGVPPACGELATAEPLGAVVAEVEPLVGAAFVDAADAPVVVGEACPAVWDVVAAVGAGVAVGVVAPPHAASSASTAESETPKAIARRMNWRRESSPRVKALVSRSIRSICHAPSLLRPSNHSQTTRIGRRCTPLRPTRTHPRVDPARRNVGKGERSAVWDSPSTTHCTMYSPDAPGPEYPRDARRSYRTHLHGDELERGTRAVYPFADDDIRRSSHLVASSAIMMPGRSRQQIHEPPWFSIDRLPRTIALHIVLVKIMTPVSGR